MNLELMVCPCKQVTLGDLVSAVKNGSSSFEEVQAATGVATACRGCKVKATALVENLLEEKKNGNL